MASYRKQLVTKYLLPLAAFSGLTLAAPGQGIVINEVLYDPPSDFPAGDANGDGERDPYDDEFVELVNVSAAPVDLAGWTIRDEVGPRHEFPAGTVLAPGCALVVFGGGAPEGFFGGALVQTASTGTLGLNNDGDTVTLSDGSGDVTSMTYTLDDPQESLNLDPDLTSSSYVRHSTLSARGASFSPGTTTADLPFCPTGVRIFDLIPDPEAGTVTLRIAGLESGVIYLLLNSTDLGDSDPWTSIGDFQIDSLTVDPDGSITNLGGGIHELVVPDDVDTAPQFYQIDQLNIGP